MAALRQPIRAELLSKGIVAMVARVMAAVDLGAESGRVMLARFDGQRIDLKEVHRFPNRPVMIRDHRFWNVFGLWDEVLIGLRKARHETGALDGIGIDTWGVDYGLVNAQGLLCSQPFHYRDHRTDGVMDLVFARVPREVVYACTGIQFLPINTLVQLYAHERQHPGELATAHRLLLIPDLLHSWLTGEMVSERTNATTTQCWNPLVGNWATGLLDDLGITSAILPPVVEPGTVLGTVLPTLQNELGVTRVIAPATHDTGSAVAATPVATPHGWAYISSGTWSLVGAELQRPMMTDEARAANWTNEGGVFGTTRFLKNIMGLWLLQECQRIWATEQRSLDYDTLLSNADTVTAHVALIDPDDPLFLAPDHMPNAINGYLETRGQRPLQSPAEFARCIMESLVLRYCEVLRSLGRLTGAGITVVHVVGGGARNARLNQWLADAMGVPIVAGPTEATALGNVLMQLAGLGEVHSLAEIRAIAQQAPTQVFEPRLSHRAVWEELTDRFAALTTRITI
jgi:rhamnulokinase